MEKIKPAIEWLKKYHFWVIISIVCIVLVVCYMSATATMAKETEDRKNKINSAVSSVTNIANERNHPNTQFLDKSKQEYVSISKDVYDAWRTLYAKQTANLAWPQGLGADALRSIRNTPDDGDIIPPIRQSYLFYVKQTVPQKLADELELMIQVIPEDPAGAEGEGAPVRPEDITLEWTDKVWWGGFNRIFAPLSGLSGTPTTLQVRKGQETIWVYQTIFETIKNLNKSATSWRTAPLTEIVSLEIGKGATARTKGNLINTYVPKTTGTAGLEGAAATTAAEKEMSVDDVVLNYRYVTPEGKALSSSDQVPSEEYNLMPLIMEVKIDHMEIPKFLTELSKAKMPVSVKQIKVTSEDAELMAVRGNVIGKGEDEPGVEIGLAPTAEEGDLRRNDVKLEVRGYIYIFNRPKPEKVSEVLVEQIEQEIAARRAELTGGGGQPLPVAPQTPPGGPVVPTPATQPAAGGNGAPPGGPVTPPVGGTPPAGGPTTPPPGGTPGTPPATGGAVPPATAPGGPAVPATPPAPTPATGA